MVTTRSMTPGLPVRAPGDVPTPVPAPAQPSQVPTPPAMPTIVPMEPVPIGGTGDAEQATQMPAAPHALDPQEYDRQWQLLVAETNAALADIRAHQAIPVVLPNEEPGVHGTDVLPEGSSWDVIDRDPILIINGESYTLNGLWDAPAEQAYLVRNHAKFFQQQVKHILETRAKAKVAEGTRLVARLDELLQKRKVLEGAQNPAAAAGGLGEGGMVGGLSRASAMDGPAAASGSGRTAGPANSAPTWVQNTTGFLPHIPFGLRGDRPVIVQRPRSKRPALPTPSPVPSAHQPSDEESEHAPVPLGKGKGRAHTKSGVGNTVPQAAESRLPMQGSKSKPTPPPPNAESTGNRPTHSYGLRPRRAPPSAAADTERTAGPSSKKRALSEADDDDDEESTAPAPKKSRTKEPIAGLSNSKKRKVYEDDPDYDDAAAGPAAKTGRKGRKTGGRDRKSKKAE